MKRRRSFIGLTVMAVAVMFSFPIIPASFADESWTQAWMEPLFPPQTQPDELHVPDLIPLAEYARHAEGDGGMHHIYAPTNPAYPGLLPGEGQGQPTEPWYHGWGPSSKIE